MTTSGSTDFTLVTNTIIEEACEIAGIASEGTPISAYTYASGKRSLNLIVKAWGAQERLWLKTRASVTLVASQADYALATLFGSKPGRVLSVRRRVTSGTIDTPLNELSRQEYEDLPNKAIDSIPTAFYYDPQVDTGTLSLWPRPSTATAAAMTLQVTYLRRPEDFDASNDTADMPQEWLRALCYTLASELALKNGRPADLRAEISARAKSYLDQIEGWDNEPASIYLQPDLSRW